MQTLEAAEEKLDDEIDKLERLDEDELERMRRRRMDELKKVHQQKQAWTQQVSGRADGGASGRCAEHRGCRAGERARASRRVLVMRHTRPVGGA